jgi:hypothetical protein
MVMCGSGCWEKIMGVLVAGTGNFGGGITAKK